MDKTLSEIDQRIAYYMFKNKLTVEKMAERMGMTANTLRSKRSGKTDWTLSEMMKLSEMLGVTLDKLAGLK